MAIKSVLGDVSLFGGLPAESLEALIETGQTLSFEAGQVVCRQGEASDAMYVILNGRVRVFKEDEQGNEVEIDALKPGDVFGEMALLDSQPRSATVACVIPCELFGLEKLAFTRLLLEPETQSIVFSVFSTVIQRLRHLMQNRFENELAQRTLQAEMEAERHRSLAQMVAGVAHELNTPLGVTNTAVDMIATRVQRETLTAPLREDSAARAILEEMEEAAELAQRNIKRANTLVLNFKKISVSQLTEIREDVNLSNLVLDILDLFKINARQAQLQIEVHDSLPENRRVWSGYPGHLTQVLTNLLFNVERHAYPSHNGGRIDIGLKLADEHTPAGFVLTVRDYGLGIAGDNLSQVFEPFFTTGRGSGGSGLGLAIVHNIVTDALKGTIEVESQLDEGATFIVTLPQIVP